MTYYAVTVIDCGSTFCFDLKQAPSVSIGFSLVIIHRGIFEYGWSMDPANECTTDLYINDRNRP